jgi:ketosteroid isomerase-like protein
MRRLITKATFLVLGAVLFSPLFAGEQPAKLKAMIEKTSDALVRATLAEDHDVVLAHYTDDVVVLPNYDRMIRGKDALVRFHEARSGSGFRFQSMDFTPVEVWAAGDLVYEIGKYAVSFTMPGAETPIADTGKFMTVWQKHRDDSLKIKVEIWNTDLNPWAEPQRDAATVAKAKAQAGQGKCPASTGDCLAHMARGLRGKGVVGLDGDWEEAAGGYRITAFAPGTKAEAAGVRIGDLLTKVNGIPLQDAEAYAADAANRQPGKPATITVVRDDQEHTLSVTLMEITDTMIAEEIGRHMLEYHLN